MGEQFNLLIFLRLALCAKCFLSAKLNETKETIQSFDFIIHFLFYVEQCERKTKVGFNKSSCKITIICKIFSYCVDCERKLKSLTLLRPVSAKNLPFTNFITVPCRPTFASGNLGKFVGAPKKTVSPSFSNRHLIM